MNSNINCVNFTKPGLNKPGLPISNRNMKERFKANIIFLLNLIEHENARVEKQGHFHNFKISRLMN